MGICTAGLATYYCQLTVSSCVLELVGALFLVFHLTLPYLAFGDCALVACGSEVCDLGATCQAAQRYSMVERLRQEYGGESKNKAIGK